VFNVAVVCLHAYVSVCLSVCLAGHRHHCQSMYAYTDYVNADTVRDVLVCYGGPYFAITVKNCNNKIGKILK